jgi:hypothetical protein
LHRRNPPHLPRPPRSLPNMRAIQLSEIAQVGDVGLVRVTAKADLIGKAIGEAEKEIGDQKTPNAYCHAWLYVGDGKKIEAAAPRVHMVPADFDRPGTELYRPTIMGSDFDLDTRLRAKERAISRLGNWYGFVAIVAILFSWARKRLTPDEVCSQLVADCYSEAGQPILSPGSPCETPDDLAASRYLRLIGKLT